MKHNFFIYTVATSWALTALVFIAFTVQQIIFRVPNTPPLIQTIQEPQPTPTVYPYPPKG